MSPNEGRAAPSAVMVAGEGDAHPPERERQPEEGQEGQRGRSPAQMGQERPRGHRGGPAGPKLLPAPPGTAEGSTPANPLRGWPASCGAVATEQAAE